tara:strand:- start:6258 stop:6926 length:669 start_codon:yes stop_codon:yes gene_type:complete
MNNKVIIEPSWYKLLENEFNKKYFNLLRQKVRNAYETSTVFPPPKLIFNAFKFTPVSQVKVIILGQDPYHQQGQAEGLSFSVPKNIKIPPSLVNIYKEISNDLNIKINHNGSLSRWANQGVLLLNNVLTVESGKPNSHKDFGWEIFTEAVINKISDSKDNLVFMLWGSNAHKKERLIDKNKHLILKSVHPSPLSAYRGFFGCKHFSICNKYLNENKIKEIKW